MTPAQTQSAQTLINDAQLAAQAFTPFAPMIGPQGALVAGIINAGLGALQAAINNGQDITDAQLAAIKAGEQAAIADDLQAQADAIKAGDTSTTSVASVTEQGKATDAPKALLGTSGPVG